MVTTLTQSPPFRIAHAGARGRPRHPLYPRACRCWKGIGCVNGAPSPNGRQIRALILIIGSYTISVSRHSGVYAGDHCPPGASDQAALIAHHPQSPGWDCRCKAWPACPPEPRAVPRAVEVDLKMEGTDAQFDRISINSAICHGQACVKGTPMPVHQIVRMMANGDSRTCFGSTPFCPARTSWLPSTTPPDWRRSRSLRLKSPTSDE